MFLTDNWKKINTDPVCFGTKNDAFGSFKIQEAGKIYSFKLVHTYGSVTCDTNFESTKWGCSHTGFGRHRLLTVITYRNKTVLPFAEFATGVYDYSKESALLCLSLMVESTLEILLIIKRSLTWR